MLTRVALAAWLSALPQVTDAHGWPFHRPAGFADVIATVTLEHPEVDARVLAATLDVVAAHESSYRLHPRGYNDGGASKGAWQTPAAETPDDALGQARVAAKWLLYSMTRCPDYPLAIYATGHVCGPVKVADYYWSQVRAELAQSPLPAPDSQP